MATSSFLPMGSRGAGAVLFSLVIAIQSEGIAQSCHSEQSGWVLGRDSSPRGCSGTGTGSPVGHSAKSSGAQEAFGKCCHALGLIFGWCGVELDSTILVAPFQLQILYDSIIL